MINTAQTMTGSSMAMRISFTTVAVSPMSCDMLYPAPTTCATSWMVAPRNTPACSGSRPSARAITGYTIIARVDNADTPITVNSVARSLA
ncbi:hypothetical protein D3C84_781340 [compost metagenome]